MSKISRLILLFALLPLIFQIAACRKKEAPAPAQPVRVSATKAYEHYFGPAPTSDKGTCYAFVIYFPSAREPGKVIPFPFFTFDEGSIKKVAIERLMSGMDIGSYQGEFIPFSSGIRLIAINENQGTVTVNLSKAPDTSNEAATARALALTLRQFKGVKDIRLQVESKEN